MISLVPSSPLIWIITDGKAGDEQPCLGVGKALGGSLIIHRISPRSLYAAFMPWGRPDPRDLARLTAPFPDLVIASGRRSIPYLRWIKRQSPNVMTVFLKHPRTRWHGADFIWMQDHDVSSRPSIKSDMITLTSPHSLSPVRLSEARTSPDSRLNMLAKPRVAVLLGGNSRHHTFTQADQLKFIDYLKQAITEGGSLMVTASRRTPENLKSAVQSLCHKTGGFFWNGDRENPYTGMLALADYIVVTADSTNMIGEAAVTGRPVLIFEPSGGHRKIAAFINDMKKAGIAHRFTGTLTGDAYSPVDATPLIARKIAEEFARFYAKSRV